MQKIADLHIHTIFSDGVLTPEEIFVKAKERGLSAISITDHDSIDACLISHSLSEKYGIEFINGIELSCHENNREIHLLGYCFDFDNMALRKALVEFREARLKRAEIILKKLDRIDVNLTFDSILEKAGQAPIARPHIASALVDKGYIHTLKEAFQLYLGEGKPAYQEKPRFSSEDAIKLINKAGGAAILAHPAQTLNQSELYKLIQKGLDGIEAVHPKHDLDMQKYFHSITSQYWLLATGGSDFHGTRDFDETNFGKFVVPMSVINSIKRHLGR